MKITKKQNKLVVEIDLWQNSYDASGQNMGKVENVVGVVVDNNDFEQGIYQVNDLGYKGSLQLGLPLIKTCLNNKDFRKLCKELDISIWEYPSCSKCKEPIWGTHTIGKDGKAICMGCERPL